MLLVVSGGIMTSCSDLLDLSPIDFYGSGSYWTTEAQVTGYMDGLHKHLRDVAEQHIFTFGELRGGIYRSGNASDGNALNYGSIILQNFDRNNTGVTGFGGHYGRLANINLFIDRVSKADYIDDAKKKFYLGQAYGLRAFIYFELYRIYGGVPLRLDVEVIDGVLDPNKLYMARATPKEVMTQIKKDLDLSMEHFGNVTAFDPYNRGKKVYWSKAATECLMGGINENKCDYNLQEATVAMTYAAGTGEYGPEASGKLAVGALAMGKVTETLGTCAVGLGWCPAGWIAGVGAAAAGL